LSEVKYPHHFSIQVALQIIKHISTGIYRDLAGSLKELVSNSFDSQATDVWINTGAPNFETITVRDNGRGLPAEWFEEAFRNVGVSQKVLHPERYANDSRPTIGKFGIGFLAAAHMSNHILVKSFHSPDEPGFEANMDLDPYFRNVPKVQATDEFKFGDVTYGRIENLERQQGTTISLLDVTKSRFHEVISLEAEEFTPWPHKGEMEARPGAGMERMVSSCLERQYISISRLSGREQIMWNLGMISPVEYLDAGPIRDGLEGNHAAEVIAALRARNKSFGFRVWFDGVQVRKPILLPTPPPANQELVDQFDAEAAGDPAVWPLDISGAPKGGRAIRAIGYVAFQPYRVVPAEMRGLLPRIRGVGVGPTYENSLLRELKGERPLYRVQLCGELYIDGGLDDELNLDRTGFLEIASEYQYLTGQVNDRVRSLVSEIDKVIGRRRRRRANVREDQAIDRLAQCLDAIGFGYEVVRLSGVALRRSGPFDFESRCAYPEGDPTVVIDHRARKLKVSLRMDHPEWIATVVAADRILGEGEEFRAKRRRLAVAIGEFPL
jgi:hypothetical protein